MLFYYFCDIQIKLTKGNLCKPLVYDLVDMMSMLLKIIFKVPLSKIFRIEEHKRKTFSWLKGIGNSKVIKGDSSLG